MPVQRYIACQCIGHRSSTKDYTRLVNGICMRPRRASLRRGIRIAAIVEILCKVKSARHEHLRATTLQMIINKLGMLGE